MDTSRMLTDLITSVAISPPEKALYTGIRKIVRGVSYETDKLPEPKLEDLMYTPMKITQLLRNYENPGEIETARTKLKARRQSQHTSVAVSTLGAAKDSRSQGFCMRQLVITQTPKWTEVDIIWRSTELIQKNTADYLLIPRLLDQLELAHTPRLYRLYMANSFVTSLFMPLLFKEMDGLEFMELLREHDPKYFRTAINAFAKFLEPTCRYNYKHRQKAYAFAHKHLDIPMFREYCHAHSARFV